MALLLECHTSWHEGLEFSPWPGHGNSIFGQVILTYMSVFTEVLGLFIYLGFYVAFNTVQVISLRVVGKAEETSTYSWSRFCTVNCRPTASNYQLSHLRPCREPNPSLRGGRRECYHSATMAPPRSLVA